MNTCPNGPRTPPPDPRAIGGPARATRFDCSHDAMSSAARSAASRRRGHIPSTARRTTTPRSRERSEEHTSELQSRLHLVCRLLLEKKKNYTTPSYVDIST